MNLKPLPTVPCKYCGKPTTYTGTKHCDPCHGASGAPDETLLKMLIERGRLVHGPALDDEYIWMERI